MILQNKVALVTGGTAGIGRATAVAFGAAGVKVVFSGRRDAEGEKTAKLIHETDGECLYVHSDASNEEDIEVLVQKTVEAYGRLDYAFNNAGIESPAKPLHEHSIRQADATRTKNLITSWRLMRVDYFCA